MKKMRNLLLMMMCLVMSIFIGGCVQNEPAPVDKVTATFSGVNDVYIKVNDSEFDFLKGVTAKDKNNKALPVTVDKSKVDFTKSGNYPIVYKAGDSAKNSIAKVLSAPIISYQDAVIANDDSITISYELANSAGGLLKNVVAKNSLGGELTVTFDNDGGFVGNYGTYSTIMSCTDEAGNCSKLNVSFIIDTANQPIVDNSVFDLGDQTSILPCDLKGAINYFVYEGANKVSIEKYEMTDNGLKLDKKYLAGLGLGTHEFTLKTELGYKQFNIEIKDEKELLIGVDGMSGWRFLEGGGGYNLGVKATKLSFQDFILTYSLKKGATIFGVTESETGLVLGGTTDEIPAGEYTLVVTAVAEIGNRTATREVIVDIQTREQFDAQYASGACEQDIDRLGTNGTEYATLTYANASESTYGSAYHYKSKKFANVDSNRIEFSQKYFGKLNAEEPTKNPIYNIKDFKLMTFDVLFVKKSPSANFALNSNSWTGSYAVDKETKERVDSADWVEGKWYTIKINLTSTAANNPMYLYVESTPEDTIFNEAYFKNFRLEKMLFEQSSWANEINFRDTTVIDGIKVGEKIAIQIDFQDRNVSGKISDRIDLIQNEKTNTAYTTNDFLFVDIYFKDSISGSLLLGFGAKDKQTYDFHNSIPAEVGTVFDDKGTMLDGGLESNKWYTLRLNTWKTPIFGKEISYGEMYFQVFKAATMYFSNMHFGTGDANNVAWKKIGANVSVTGGNTFDGKNNLYKLVSANATYQPTFGIKADDLALDTMIKNYQYFTFDIYYGDDIVDIKDGLDAGEVMMTINDAPGTYNVSTDTRITFTTLEGEAVDRTTVTFGKWYTVKVPIVDGKRHITFTITTGTAYLTAMKLIAQI